MVNQIFLTIMDVAIGGTFGLFLCGFFILIMNTSYVEQTGRSFYWLRKSQVNSGRDSTVSKLSKLRKNLKLKNSPVENASVKQEISGDSTICKRSTFYDVLNSKEFSSYGQHDDETIDIIPHCLGIIHKTKSLTECLLSAKADEIVKGGGEHNRIVECVRNLTTGIYELNASLHPPIYTKTVESKANALCTTVLCLSTLLVEGYEDDEYFITWINENLAELENHRLYIQEAAVVEEAQETLQWINGLVST